MTVLIGNNFEEEGKTWARAFEESGIRAVTMQKNGKDILNSVLYDTPDVLIIEAKMPGMDAVSLLEEISKLRKPLKTIVISNYDSPSLEREIMYAGAKYYFVKPFEPETLVNRVKNLVRDKIFT